MTPVPTNIFFGCLIFPRCRSRPANRRHDEWFAVIVTTFANAVRVIEHTLIPLENGQRPPVLVNEELAIGSEELYVSGQLCPSSDIWAAVARPFIA
jgi:hypothetical protein